MMRPFFIKTKTLKNFRPIKARITIGDFMDYFLKKQFERIRLELQEMIGILSIKELTTNFRFIDEYKQLHRAYARI